MTVDFLLDGLAEALELERELGVKAVECDRALLAPLKAAPRALTPGSGEDTGRASPIASQSPRWVANRGIAGWRIAE